MTCADCEAMAHELDALRREVRGEGDVVRLGTLCATLNLTRAHATVVMALYEAKGRAVSRQRIEGLTSRLDGYESNTVSTMISRIRSQIGRDLIETVWGLGYRLTIKGQSRVCDALEAA